MTQLFFNQNKSSTFALQLKPKKKLSINLHINKKNLHQMTKADIVNEIAKTTGIDKVTVLTTVEAFMETVKESLSKNENVYLRGFGSFIIKERAEKTARNISKNTTIIIPAHNIPSFKPAKTFVSVVK
jgi:DNA-binding protein HU-beta